MRSFMSSLVCLKITASTWSEASSPCCTCSAIFSAHSRNRCVSSIAIGTSPSFLCTSVVVMFSTDVLEDRLGSFGTSQAQMHGLCTWTSCHDHVSSLSLSSGSVRCPRLPFVALSVWRVLDWDARWQITRVHVAELCGADTRGKLVF